jgi:hypothetical protein
MSNSFLDVLRAAPPLPDLRAPAIALLREMADAITQFQQGVKCDVVPGFKTNMGQEYRVVISSSATGYEHTLLRAYLPLNGFPAKLDLYDFSMIDVADAPQLEAVLKDFLQKPETLAALAAYSK